MAKRLHRYISVVVTVTWRSPGEVVKKTGIGELGGKGAGPKNRRAWRRPLGGKGHRVAEDRRTGPAELNGGTRIVAVRDASYDAEAGAAGQHVRWATEQACTSSWRIRLDITRAVSRGRWRVVVSAGPRTALTSPFGRR